MRMVEIATVEMERMNTFYFPIDEIMSDIAGVYGIKNKEFVGFNRKRELTIPRQVFIYVACMYSKNTLVEIGELMGGRDHTTIIHARDTASRHLSTRDPVFMNYWNEYITNSYVWCKINKDTHVRRKGIKTLK